MSNIECPPLVEYGGSGLTAKGDQYYLWTDTVTGSTFYTGSTDLATVEAAAISKREQYRKASESK